MDDLLKTMKISAAGMKAQGTRLRVTRPTSRLVSREVGRVTLDVSNRAHVGGGPRRSADFAEERTRHPYESAPAGNAVILEEQMMKVGATTMSYRLTTELYKKHLNMIRTALGRRQ